MTDKENETDFQQMWVEAQINFEKKTNKSLVRSCHRSLEDVLKDLDQQFNAQDSQEDGKQQHVRRLASNVLNFIQLLGGVAAQAGSVIFGPADLCFNAMQFLIDIPAKISNFYDGLALLFEEISTSLKQFKIYQRIEKVARVDVELKQCIHKLMIIFVDICAISIDVLSGSRLHSWKINAKVALFDDDSGVGAQLDKLRSLVKYQSQISDAVTLEHVLKSEHKLEDIDQGLMTVKSETEALVQYADASKGQENQRDRFNQICNKLSVTPETVQKLEREFDEIRSWILPNTGSWLDDIDLFKRWTDLESDVDPQLLLIGKNGSGKSSLAFSILHDLRHRYSTGSRSAPRVYTAFHRFAKTEKPLRDDPSKYALKCIAAQVAHQDVVHSKRLKSLLGSKDGSSFRDMSVMELSERLIPALNDKDAPDIGYVLLLDGLDQLPDDDASQLLDALFAIKSSKLRIILTGTEETFSEKNLDLLTSIRVTDRNKEDIKRFINSELRACKILQEDLPEISRIVDSIRLKLPEIGKGCFNDVRQIISKVSAAVEYDQPEDQIAGLISADTLTNKDITIERLVYELNSSLNTSEIGQLNELLAWIIYGFEYMTMEEMRAALFLCTKRTSLSSLETKVRQRYSKLLKIEPENTRHDHSALEMRDADFESYFRGMKREIQEIGTDGNDDPKISMTITIDHVNLSKVQRFFWDLSENIVFERFPFNKAVTNLEQTTQISADFAQGHLTLARRCFEVLLDEPTKETKVLGAYASVHLLEHLDALSRDSSLRMIEREDILTQLVRVLQDADYIEEHLTERFFRWDCWLDDGSEIEALHAWLSDLDAAKTNRLNPKDRQWLWKVNSGNRLLALANIATMIARQWLCQRTWPAQLPFQWIDRFLRQLEANKAQEHAEDERQSAQDSIKTSDRKDETEDAGVILSEENLSVSRRIQRAVEWAQEKAGFVENSLWHERLGDTYLDYGGWEFARDAFLKAKEFPGNYWKMSESLAEAYARTNKINLAVEEMETVLTHLRGTEELPANDKETLIVDLLRSANWQTELQNTDDAAIKMREAIQLDQNHYQSYYELLRLYIRTGQGPKALELFNELATFKAEDSSLTRLEAMFLDFADKGTSLEGVEYIFHVTGYGDVSQIILQNLQNALLIARTSKPAAMNSLLLCRGVALAHYGTDEERFECALEDWKECCRRCSQSEQWEHWDLALTAAKQILNFHFSETKLTGQLPSDFGTRINALHELTEGIRSPYFARQLRYLLGSFYSFHDARDKAHALLLNDMKSGMDILSDDDPKNDYMGYQIIAEILMHTRDDLNALSAWSLYGPSERYDNDEHELNYSCDGTCNKTLTFADSMWLCKVCNDVSFDDECFEKLCNGTLERFVCSSDHEWLRIPSWTDECNATGKDHVRVGGELQDGKRVGGQIVPIGQWLDTIKEKWSIEKPATSVKDEDAKREEG